MPSPSAAKGVGQLAPRLSPPIYSFTTRYSATSTAPAAPPMRVLWLTYGVLADPADGRRHAPTVVPIEARLGATRRVRRSEQRPPRAAIDSPHAADAYGRRHGSLDGLVDRVVSVGNQRQGGGYGHQRERDHEQLLHCDIPPLSRVMTTRAGESFLKQVFP